MAWQTGGKGNAGVAGAGSHGKLHAVKVGIARVVSGGRRVEGARELLQRGMTALVEDGIHEVLLRALHLRLHPEKRNVNNREGEEAGGRAFSQRARAGRMRTKAARREASLSRRRRTKGMLSVMRAPCMASSLGAADPRTSMHRAATTWASDGSLYITKRSSLRASLHDDTRRARDRFKQR